MFISIGAYELNPLPCILDHDSNCSALVTVLCGELGELFNFLKDTHPTLSNGQTVARARSIQVHRQERDPKIVIATDIRMNVNVTAARPEVR